MKRKNLFKLSIRGFLFLSIFTLVFFSAPRIFAVSDLTQLPQSNIFNEQNTTNIVSLLNILGNASTLSKLTVSKQIITPTGNSFFQSILDFETTTLSVIGEGLVGGSNVISSVYKNYIVQPIAMVIEGTTNVIQNTNIAFAKISKQIVLPQIAMSGVVQQRGAKIITANVVNSDTSPNTTVAVVLPTPGTNNTIIGSTTSGTIVTHTTTSHPTSVATTSSSNGVTSSLVLSILKKLLADPAIQSEIRGPEGPQGPAGTANVVAAYNGYTAPNPAINYYGATYSSATNVSSNLLNTNTANIANLTVSGGANLGSLSDIGDASVGGTLTATNIVDSGLTNQSCIGTDATGKLQAGTCSGSSQWTTTGSDIYYNTGNVGIGTTTPTEPLEVAGNTQVTGHLALGSSSAVNDCSGSLIIDYGGCTTNAPLNIEETMTNLTSNYPAGILNAIDLNPSVPGYSGNGIYNVLGSDSTNTGAFGDIIGVNNSVGHDGSGSADGLGGTNNDVYDAVGDVSTMYGTSNDLETDGGNIGNLYGTYNEVDDDSNGTIANQAGTFNDSYVESSGGTVTENAGSINIAEAGYGTNNITQNVGSEVDTTNILNAGTITDNYGVLVNNPTSNHPYAGMNIGTITNNYGVDINAPINSVYTYTGIMTNNYGLYIADQSTSGATNNFNIYSAGSGANYFGGGVQLASITGSTQCLQVDSSGNVTGTGVACGSGGSSSVGPGNVYWATYAYVSGGTSAYTSNNWDDGYSSTESDVSEPVSAAGTISKLYIQTTSTQPSDGPLVVTLRKNGADTPVTITIPASSTAGTYSDLTDTVTVSPGDILDLKVDNSVSSSTSAFVSEATFSFVASTSNTENAFWSTYGDASGGEIVYTSNNYDYGYSSTESDMSEPVSAAGTISKLYIQTLYSQPSDGPLVVTLRKNGTSTPIVITVPASSAAGIYSDLTHSVTVSPGDVLDLEVDNSVSSSNSAIVNEATFSFTASTSNTENTFWGTDGAPNAGSTVYTSNHLYSYSYTESDVSEPVSAAGTISKLYIQTGSYQPSDGPLVVTLRKNGADTPVVVTIPASSVPGTYSDLTHSVTVSPGDILDLKVDNSVSGSSSAAVTEATFTNTLATTGGSGAQWVTSGDNLYNGNSGNVGIGTTTPSNTLTVNGDIGLDGDLLENGNTVLSSGNAYTLTGSTLGTNVDVNTVASDPQHASFSTDGSKMYVVDAGSKKVYQYNLSTPWDVSSATYSSNSLSLSSQTGSDAVSVSHWKPDGTELYVLDLTSYTIYEYDVTSAWDLSSASYDTNYHYYDIYDFAFTPDGSTLYAVLPNSHVVVKFTLSTDWEISSASLTAPVLVFSSSDYPYGMQFTNNGSYMVFQIANMPSTATVNGYNLGTAYNVSTATPDGTSYNLSSYVSSGEQVVSLDSDNSKFYLPVTGDGSINSGDASIVEFDEAAGTSKVMLTISGNATVSDNAVISGHTALGNSSAVDDCSLLDFSSPCQSAPSPLNIEETVTSFPTPISGYVWSSGINSTVDFNPSAALSFGNLLSGINNNVIIDSASTQDIPQLYGTENYIENDSSGNTIDSIVGTENYIFSSGNSNISSVEGLSTGFYGGTGSVGSVYGVEIGSNIAAGGTISDNYGLYISDESTTATGATNGWNIWSDGSGINYFSGDVGIGTSATVPSNLLQVTGTPLAGVSVAQIDNTLGGTTQNNALLIQGGNNTGVAASQLITFERPDTTIIGSITQNAASTVAFNTSSDQRIKQNITPTTYGLADLMKINVDDFSFISDSSNQKITGFIAQNLYTIFPEAVTTNGDDGTVPLAAGATPWMVDYSKVTPLIVKAVQDMGLNIEGIAGTYTPIPGSDSDNFVTAFFKNIETKLVAWFGDAGNGIGNLFAGTITVKNELCIGVTCVNQSQLQTLLNMAGQGQLASPTVTTTPPPTTTDTTPSTDTTTTTPTTPDSSITTPPTTNTDTPPTTDSTTSTSTDNTTPPVTTSDTSTTSTTTDTTTPSATNTTSPDTTSTTN